MTKNLNKHKEQIAILEKKIKILENQKTKKYGIVWEEKPEEFEKLSRNSFPILKEKGGKFKDILQKGKEHKDFNILIEGDNYHALKVLNYTHKEKIDIIYIDPPYNTGNKDFIYNDSFVDKEDSYRHSKWLSFMSKRLLLAKSLLSNNGLIFISIDDNEQANLKLLCDQIFGEKNFVNNIVNQSAKSVFGSKASAKEKTIIKVKDYVLVYKKNNIDLNPLYIKSKYPIFTSHDLVYEQNKKISTQVWFEREYQNKFREKGLKISKKNILKLLTEDKEWGIEVFKKLLDIQYSSAVYTKELDPKIIDKLKKGNIVKHNKLLLMNEDNGKGRTRFLRSLRQSSNFVNGTNDFCKVDILGDVWDTSEGYGNINVEGNIKFKNGKKPLILLKNIISLSKKENPLILDFFAGSGTTGHAVLELNKNDGKNRRFILCQNNEENISEEITYQRFTNIKELGGNLKYLKTTFVKKELKDKITDQDKLNLAHQIGLLIALKENTFLNEIKNEFYQIFKGNNKVTAIYFRESKEKLKDLLKGLSSHNVPIKLYIFTWQKGGYKFEFNEYKNIIVEDIPQPILEVYRNIGL